jgi:WD40 repeat protein
MRFAAKLLVIVLLITYSAVVCAEEKGRPRFSPDGAILATLEQDCTVSLWDVASGNRIAAFADIASCSPWQQRACRTVSAFSPDEKLEATQTTYGPVMLWDAKTGRKLATFGGTGDDGVSLIFSRDSKLLLSVVNVDASRHKDDRSNGISVWDVLTQEELLRVREDQKTEFNKAVLSPDGRTVVALVATKCTEHTYRKDRCVTDTIRIWDIESGKERLASKGQSAKFSPDSKSLIVNDSGREIVLDISAGMTSSPAQQATPSRARGLTLTADNVAKSVGDNKWNWTVFIKGDRQDIESVKCVEYKLHPSFPNPVRRVCELGDPKLPFGLSATGWGTFSIGIWVFMKDGTHQDLKHQLKF